MCTGNAQVPRESCGAGAVCLKGLPGLCHIDKKENFGKQYAVSITPHTVCACKYRTGVTGHSLVYTVTAVVGMYTLQVRAVSLDQV